MCYFSSVFTSLLVLVAPSTARAHFVWVLLDHSPDGPTSTARVVFAETARPGAPEHLGGLGKLALWRLGPGETEERVDLLKTELEGGWALTAAVPPGAVQLEAECPHGLLEKGGEGVLLNYFARSVDLGALPQPQISKRLRLDLCPRIEGQTLLVKVCWNGRPVPWTKVLVSFPSGGRFEIEAGADGCASFDAQAPGLYQARATFVEEQRGALDGKEYRKIRNYCTLTCVMGNRKEWDGAPKPGLPDLPEGLTSFGAAVLGNSLYLQGGHRGRAHHYTRDEQSGSLLRLDLTDRGVWTRVLEGPALQGLGLAAAGGRLYRAGGLQVLNGASEAQDLRSSSEVSSFDPVVGKWKDLPALPEPRSSHDLAAGRGKLYVVGGWNIEGAEKIWHETAWMLPLEGVPEDRPPSWEKLPAPPFRRRALALVCAGKRLLAIGGMDESEGATTSVDVLDLDSGLWSQGPRLPGESMEGFGVAACVASGKVHVSTHEGLLLCLSEHGETWIPVGRLAVGRFFHRMVFDGEKLLVVGGANRKKGKPLGVEVINSPVFAASTR